MRTSDRLTSVNLERQLLTMNTTTERWKLLASIELIQAVYAVLAGDTRQARYHITNAMRRF